MRRRNWRSGQWWNRPHTRPARPGTELLEESVCSQVFLGLDCVCGGITNEGAGNRQRFLRILAERQAHAAESFREHFGVDAHADPEMAWHIEESPRHGGR